MQDKDEKGKGQVKIQYHPNKAINKAVEFSYWLVTEQGSYYREMVSSLWIILFFLILIAADIIIMLYKDYFSLSPFTLLFAYIIYKKAKSMIAAYKEHKDAIAKD